MDSTEAAAGCVSKLGANLLPGSADPRVQLFITHAGMNSYIELARSGVPALCVPLSVDQHVNAAGAVQLGVAVQLEKDNLTLQSLTWAIQTMLGDTRY